MHDNFFLFAFVLFLTRIRVKKKFHGYREFSVHSSMYNKQEPVDASFGQELDVERNYLPEGNLDIARC